MGPEKCRTGVLSFLKGTEQPLLGAAWGPKTTSPEGVHFHPLPGLVGTSLHLWLGEGDLVVS